MGKTQAYKVVGRVWPSEFMAMLSEVPPPFAHAAVAAACRALRPGEAEALLRSAPPAFDVRVEGTAPIETVDFFRGTQCLRSVDLLAQSGTLVRLIFDY